MSVTLDSLKPNDAAGAVKVARDHMEHGAWGEDIAEILLSMQTNPANYIRLLRPHLEWFEKQSKKRPRK